MIDVVLTEWLLVFKFICFREDRVVEELGVEAFGEFWSGSIDDGLF